MSLLLLILSLYIPVFIRKRRLRELFTITADAFKCEVPVLKSSSYKECLLQYALFTKEQVERCIRNGSDIRAIKNQLYEKAYSKGNELAKKLSVATPDKAILTCRILYKAIGIKFEGTSQGEITMHKCFFSQVYSPEVCYVISSLDEGIISGLTGGARLTFSQRITEGAKSCKAHLSKLIYKS